MNTETIKKEIKKSYGDIANGKIEVGCCNSTDCCGTSSFMQPMNEDYANIKGYVQEADYSLGCGLPTEIANINEGNVVLDLGSGAGNDVFIARRIVGETGRVIGIDMTPEMVEKANNNKMKLGFANVEFHLGEIEEMTAIKSDLVDVVISNCVMNLVPDKEKAFKEVHRVLKNGGHFSISDIVYKGTLPNEILEAPELFAGCVAGASHRETYLSTIKSVGFKNIQVKKERFIDTLSDELLLNYLTSAQLEEFKNSGSGIYSITVYADKLEEGACCETAEGECCSSKATAANKKSSYC
jgi:ubiquinone/menaquinone biosynthesis C-methylase UbiE